MPLPFWKCPGSVRPQGDCGPGTRDHRVLLAFVPLLFILNSELGMHLLGTSQLCSAPFLM